MVHYLWTDVDDDDDEFIYGPTPKDIPNLVPNVADGVTPQRRISKYKSVRMSAVAILPV